MKRKERREDIHPNNIGKKWIIYTCQKLNVQSLEKCQIKTHIVSFESVRKRAEYRIS